MRGNEDLRKAIMEIMNQLLPEIRRQLFFPIKARVSKVYTQANRYLVDVVPLRNNGEAMSVLNSEGNEVELQVIKEVPVNTFTNGPERGVFALPVKDSVVRLSFYGGDLNYPFVDAVLADKTPALEAEEVGMYQGTGHFVRLLSDGSLEVMTPGNITVNAGGDAAIVSAGNASLISGGDVLVQAAGSVDIGGSGGSAVARVGDAVEVDGKTGQITEGSSKVNAT